MGKNLALSLLLVIICRFSFAQKDTTFLFTADDGYTRYSGKICLLGITGGMGKYFQPDLKELNQTARDELTFDTEFTDNFPATFYYGIYYIFRISRSIYAGPDYKFHTTGSRLAYRDYSGSYTFDQIISTHSVALRFEAAPGSRKNPQVSLNALFGINIATWRISEKLAIGEQEESSSLRFDALRPFIYPSLRFRCRLAQSISLSPSVGFNFDLWGKYHLHSNKKAEMGKKAVWTGPRAELSLDYFF